MGTKIRKRNVVVLLENIDNMPEGLMVIVDDVDDVDNIIEFELNNYYKSVPIPKVRIATIKEKYHYDFWKKHGRNENLMNIHSIVD